MCCCNCPRFYKNRLLILATLSLLEAILGLFRVFIYVSLILPANTASNSTGILDITHPMAIAFILDCASSITAIFMGILMLLFFALFQCFCCISCIYAICRTKSRKNGRGYCESFSTLKALHRFMTLDCNCPCYRARPKLRFRLRFAFLMLCLGLRGVAIYLYKLVSETDSRGLSNFYSCLASTVFLVWTFILDLYHYAVWWHYTPHDDTRCHCRSRKHKRYIPYHIVGDNQRKDILGDRPCTTDPCSNRHLSHIVVFHGRNYKPQARWSTVKANDSSATYIGFHTTTSNAAINIVHSEFRLSEKGMLGKGVYFARSIEDTIGKAQCEGGACIVAQIHMGKVFEFDKRTVYPIKGKSRRDEKLRDFVKLSKWHEEYDTCYMNHEIENKDEFCIKDPEKQIIKWVVVVDQVSDPKVGQYGLDTEFDSTRCYCI